MGRNVWVPLSERISYWHLISIIAIILISAYGFLVYSFITKITKKFEAQEAAKRAAEDADKIESGPLAVEAGAASSSPVIADTLATKL